jgi:murein DD-endopeptidase MepM/ murein hydrolase activator NlpD
MSESQETLEQALGAMPRTTVLDIDGAWIAVDLSEKNEGFNACQTAIECERYIQEYLNGHNASAAFGGYNEKRALYRRSAIFNDEGEERDIHIGLDIWTKAGTRVLAPVGGTVHSFGYNAGVGNYGPTIILEHKTGNLTFYTLYGHLSVASIENLEIGDVFKRGDAIGTLGVPSENGDYAPHLHFQLIADIGDAFGDYPGVSSRSDLAFYLENCPDPNLFLKFNKP